MVMIKEWFMGLGEQYWVNPIILRTIYVGAMPFFSLSNARLTKNLKKKKSILLPLFLTRLFFISVYLYIIAAGKNVPVWGNVVIIALQLFVIF